VRIPCISSANRTLWNQAFIAEGQRLVEQALRSRRFRVYTIQASISAVHAEAKLASETDWAQIVALYDVLMRADSSPVVELNRAVAIAMRDDEAAGLAIIDAILSRGELQNYYLAHSARGELLRRLGNQEQAKVAFERTLSLANQQPEQRFLRKRVASIELTSVCLGRRERSRLEHHARDESVKIGLDAALGNPIPE